MAGRRGGEERETLARRVVDRRALLGGVFGALLMAALIGAISVGMSLTQPGNREGSGGEENRARNVILFVGDGMGDSEITIARNYEVGAAGTLAMDTLPMSGAYTTYSVKRGDPETPEYVTDSAAAATALATGRKTSNTRISTAPGTGEDPETILELAREAGYSTGSVTTAALTDATPAAFAAHVDDRRCQGPEGMEYCPEDRKSEGGPGSIAEQLLDNRVDVLLGGGRSIFGQTIDGGPDDGRTVVEAAARQGYDVVGTAGELKAAQPDGRLLGLFADKDLAVSYDGKPASQDNGGKPQRCAEDVRPAEQPGLDEMTRKAIELLDGRGRGFFLMVESASIDKQAHISNPCRQIGETIQLDDAVGVALDYAEENPDTLIVVTADHGHTGQIIPAPNSDYFPDRYEYDPPGETISLITADGTTMAVSYATNRYRDENGEAIDQENRHTHTGTQVPVAARGPQAERVLGVNDQTAFFDTAKAALGL